MASDEWDRDGVGTGGASDGAPGPALGATPGEVDVVVVGGGLAGLVAAVHAARGGASVALLESGRGGGRARVSTVDPGVVFNAGPRALYRGGAAARELAALGVTWSGGAPPTTGSMARCAGVTRVLPGTAPQLLSTRLLGMRSKVRVGALLGSIQRLDAARLVGRSVDSWFADLQLRPDAVALVRAVLRLATYMDDTARMDAGAAVQQLQLALGEGVVYVDGGWQSLVDQLTAQALAAGVAVHSHCSVRAVRRADAGWRVDTGAAELGAAAVVLAAGPPAAVEALSHVRVHHGDLGPVVSAACLELSVRTPPTTRFLLGIDTPLYLSEHAPPARLAPEGLGVVHVLRYGTTEREADLAELWAHAAAAGVRRDDVVAERFLRRMVVSGAVPSAAAGGLAGRPAVQVDGAPGLFLAGDWVGAEGLLADAAVASGVRAGGNAAAVAREQVARRASAATGCVP